MKKYLLALLLTVMVPFALMAETIQITDASINAGDNVTWTKSNVYLLGGLVFVEEGATLTIEAGTVVKGKPGEGENASALIITRGAKIYANGSATEPIIFTFEADDPSDAFDQSLEATGQWGGIIVLGKSIINDPAGENNVEGIPSDEPRGVYGGTDVNDNSGVIKYVSIRHGGTNIGANNEINGLSLGGVGAGTTIEHVEVYRNQDDGFEFFGGTVKCKYLVSAFNGDDAFDWDEGYNGGGQFWFAIQSPNSGNNGAEQDSGTDPEDAAPYAMPELYNVTFIGSGLASANGKSRGFHFRDNSGGTYKNTLLFDFGGKGIEIEDLDASKGHDSRERLEAGDLVLENMLWYGIGDNTLDGIAPDVLNEDGSVKYSQDFVRTYLGTASNNNWVEDIKMAGVSREPNGGLDPRAKNGTSPIVTKPAASSSNSWYETTDYIGAFYKENWLNDWTFLSEAGYLGNLADVDSYPTTGVKENTVSSFSVYPNPTNNVANIDVKVAVAGNVKVVVYDVLGNEVAVIANEFLFAGNHTMTWNVNVLSGTYYVAIHTMAGTEMISLNVSK